MSKRCIVMGASAGGVEAFKDVVAGLAADLPAPVFIVLHIPPYVVSSLPAILSAVGPLKAVHPKDGEKIKEGVIYVAPPDHHLLIVKNKMAVKKGPKENRFRPSVDALFRSAAYTYGPGAIGVILSGALDDGTSGLWTIQQLGGVSVVQTPNQARFESMPRSALEYVDANYQMSSLEIGGLLSRLVLEPVAPEDNSGDKEMDELKKRIKTEVDIAAETGAFQKGAAKMGEPSSYTCPECHGVLVKISEGKISRFRCHTGHSYTDNALLEAVMETSEETLWQVIRGLEESVMLLNDMGKKLEDAGNTDRAGIFFAQAQTLEKRAVRFQSDALKHEILSREKIEQLQ
jgi:two-component system, chemotaxis family, protein-glutamate methylesterase/glutaminase